MSKLRKHMINWLMTEDLFDAYMYDAFGFNCIPFIWYSDFKSLLMHKVFGVQVKFKLNDSDWICMSCDGKGNTMKDILSEIKLKK